MTRLVLATWTMAVLALSVGCDGTAAPFDTTAAARDLAPAPCITPEDTKHMADQALQLINLERGALGIAPVASDEKLERIASRYACLLISEGFFGHFEPLTGDGPGVRAVAGKYAFYTVGENLAAGQETPAEVIKGWMASRDHRRILLDPQFKQVGITVRTGGEYGIYWVAEFGDPVAR
ncbi:MAG: CAP domain-containing protein [Phycisphaerae bacterium]